MVLQASDRCHSHCGMPGGIALMQEQVYLARFCFILVGGLFGFLWFNVHPAELIMGDTGSLSLGAVLAVISLMAGYMVDVIDHWHHPA